MHVADVTITNDWTTLTSLITTVEADAEYVIINNSPIPIYAVEGDAEPTNDIVGAVVPPTCFVSYKKGSQAELYLRNSSPSLERAGVEADEKETTLTINKVG